MSKIADELKQIMGDHETLETQTVIDWARKNPGSAIYNSLEWDDHEAAERWRNWQIRQLIAIHVVAEDGRREFVSLSIDRGKGGGYRDIGSVLRTKDLRQILLDDALRELDRVQAKYAQVQELARVWDAAAEVKTRKQRRTKQPAATPQIGVAA